MAAEQLSAARPRGVIRLAWFVVLAMMLTGAAWSISDQLVRWGTPAPIAYGLSITFDASALICADLAGRAVERGTPAGLPRLAIAAFTGVAGIVNWHHGKVIGGPVAAAAFAALSALAELLFELRRRDVRDEHRAAAGLIPARLPRVPVVAWLMYPGRSWGALRAAVGARLDTLDPVQQHHPDSRPDSPGLHPRTVRTAIRTALDREPDASADEIADRLSSIGVVIDADTVREVLDSAQDSPDSTSARTLGRTTDTITDTVRTAVASGITLPDSVLSAVRATHGPAVRRDTVVRIINRVQRGV